jgi:hypothetical protein
MEWYCALTRHLLNKNNTADGREPSEPIPNLLEGKVVEFYKTILLYQMKSICSYYRNQGLVFLRGLVDLDKWDDDVQSVKDAEDTLLKDWKNYNKVKAEELSTERVELAKEMGRLLGDIHQDLREFFDQQQKIQVHGENKECLRDLRVVNPQDDMKRIEDEKEELFDDAYKWILEDDRYAAFTNWDESNLPTCRLLWVKGHAGTGKTMHLIGIIRQLSKQLAPTLSYFFCQGQGKTDPPLNNATATLRSLIWMLLIQQPHLISHLQTDYGSSGGALFTDSNALIALSRLFMIMLEDAGSVYFIVDALDECDQGLENFVKLISNSLTLSDKVRWLVSSRPEIGVLSKLKDPDISRVVDLNAQGLADPVNAYINHKLSTLEQRDGYDQGTLRAVSDEIRSRAENIFLWVALVFKVLDEDDGNLGPVHGSYALEIVKEIPPGLSDMYGHMMTRIEKRIRRDPQYCKNVLVAAALTYRPLSFSELAVLAGLRPKSEPEPQTIVQKCGSFLTTNEERVSVIHQSAKDYLDTNHSRLQPGGVAQGHADITRRSINAMSTLKSDIYDLRQYGIESKDLTPPEEDPLAPIRYSCVFWLDHLRNAIKANPENSKELCDLGFGFLKEHFLHWLESLSLLCRLSDGIMSLRKLLNVVKVYL